jgi:predicted kinase
MLIVFGGLPGSGKTTLSRALAQEMHAAWLRVDLIEAATLRAGVAKDQPTGYAAYCIASALAEAHLDMGTPTVVDAVNPVEAARQWWREVAAVRGVPLRVIEVVCSSESEHRRRVSDRTSDLEGFPMPSWDDVVNREYEPWTQERIVVDTATEPVAVCLSRIRAYTLS